MHTLRNRTQVHNRKYMALCKMNFIKQAWLLMYDVHLRFSSSNHYIILSTLRKTLCYVC